VLVEVCSRTAQVESVGGTEVVFHCAPDALGLSGGNRSEADVTAFASQILIGKGRQAGVVWPIIPILPP